MFYDHYEELCKKANKKPYTVAREIGLGTSNVAQWKKGSTPRPEILQKLSEYFDVSQAVLLGFEQKENPTASGEGLDPTTKELFELVESASESERKMMLEMLRVLKRGGK